MKYDKNFYINAFFKDFRKRINNVKKIINLGFKEEGVILAICQIDALANFRYEPKRGENKKYFKKLVEEYYKGVPKISAYTDDFYRYFRCAGIHEGRISISWQLDKTKHFIFSIQGVLSILEDCFNAIEQACLEKNKWPHEL